MKTNNNSKNINSTLIKESLLDYNNLATQIKENAPDLVKNLLGEQVRQAYASLLNESDDEEIEDKDYDVEEVDDTISEPAETEDEETIDSEVENTEDDVEDGMEPDETEDAEITDDTEIDSDVDTVDGEDEISQSFDKFKTSEGEYDFRNAKDDELVKVYKLLKNDDNVTVVKDNSKVQISDNETGAEYIIDLGNDTETSDKLMDDNINTDDMNESRIYEIALNEYDSHVGYTDNYQKKDVMTTDGVSEPSKMVETLIRVFHKIHRNLGQNKRKM